MEPANLDEAPVSEAGLALGMSWKTRFISWTPHPASQIPLPNLWKLKRGGGSSKSIPYFTHGFLVMLRHTNFLGTWMALCACCPHRLTEPLTSHSLHNHSMVMYQQPSVVKTRTFRVITA